MEAATSQPDAPTTPLEVRERLVEALELDLVGPWPGHELAEERLPGWERPSNWYLTGFLIPVRSADEEAGDVDSDEEVDEPQEDDPSDDGAEDRTAAKRRYFPSSLGLSTLVAAGVAAISVTVRWGDYTVGEQAADEDGESDGESRSRPRRVWQRTPQERTIEVPLSGSSSIPRVIPVPDSGGLELHILERPFPRPGSTGGSRRTHASVSVFLVNDRDPDPKQRDRAYAFQAELEVGCEQPFVPRPDLRGAGGRLGRAGRRPALRRHAGVRDRPRRLGRLGARRWANAGCCGPGGSRRPRSSRRSRRTIGGVELADGGARRPRRRGGGAGRARAARQRSTAPGSNATKPRSQSTRRRTAVRPRRQLLAAAGFAAGRIERGIATLAGDPDALDAFRVANRAVAKALRRRLPEVEGARVAAVPARVPADQPARARRPGRRRTARPSISSTSRREAARPRRTWDWPHSRSCCDGCGSTDAGRLTGAGVTVVMRYTLRLLTLDQLSRAAGLICALELERQDDPERLRDVAVRDRAVGRQGGDTERDGPQGRRAHRHGPFACPAVQGQSAGQAVADPARGVPVVPDERSRPASFSLLPDSDQPRELRIVCTNFECDFTRDRPLPIVAVDEPLYRRLPAFLIATVDKFAALPWVGPSGALLGGASRYDATGFYGAAEPGRGTPLPEPLPPPDLVIQDELHLISGPLGTMAGLYETAIDGLCQRELDNQVVAPKIVASTATVRRAQDQIQALFARATHADLPAARAGPPRLVLRTHRSSVNTLRRAATSASPPRAATRRW